MQHSHSLLLQRLTATAYMYMCMHMPGALRIGFELLRKRTGNSAPSPLVVYYPEQTWPNHPAGTSCLITSITIVSILRSLRVLQFLSMLGWSYAS
jgi:hypothetical protein